MLHCFYVVVALLVQCVSLKPPSVLSLDYLLIIITKQIRETDMSLERTEFHSLPVDICNQGERESSQLTP